MMLKVVVFVVIKTAACAFFDLTDVEDPLSLFWQQSKDFTITPTSTNCIVPIPGTGRVIPGQCKHKTLCLLSGGQTNNNGNCGNFLTCCTKSSNCSHRTKAKVSYFINDLSNAATSCEHTVEVMNENICQVRLDFEQFHLTPVSSNSLPTRLCPAEYLTVTPEVNHIPQFCGYNNGQHAYVHLNGQREVKLSVNFRAGTVGTPTWRIRVTQLECVGRRSWLGKHNVFGYLNDLPLLAPQDVVQYFTEPSGRITSFGYNGQDYYTSGLYYAIAFKRTPSTNCIRFTINDVTLIQNIPMQDPPCIDYLFFPEVQDGTNIIEKVTCQESATVFQSNVPGPFYIYFRSKSEAGTGVPLGFDVQYELTTCPFI